MEIMLFFKLKNHILYNRKFNFDKCYNYLFMFYYSDFHFDFVSVLKLM